MADEKKPASANPKPKPKPETKSSKDLPVNPRDMTPGRKGAYQTR